jgi:hypothetical protein
LYLFLELKWIYVYLYGWISIQCITWMHLYIQLRHKNQAPAVKQTEARNTPVVKIFRWAELARNTANPAQDLTTVISNECGERADALHQTRPLPNSPRGQSVETQQPWEQLVRGWLLLIQEVHFYSVCHLTEWEHYIKLLCITLCPNNVNKKVPSSGNCSCTVRVSYMLSWLYIFSFRKINHHVALPHAFCGKNHIMHAYILGTLSIFPKIDKISGLSPFYMCECSNTYIQLFPLFAQEYSEHLI